MVRPINMRHVILPLLAVLAFVLSQALFAHAECGDARADSVRQITVSGDAKLDSSCIYRQTIAITQSDTTLDCRGALIDLNYASGSGIIVRPAPRDVVKNITIKNCKVKRPSKSGVEVFSAGLGLKGQNDDSLSADQMRSYSPRNVVIDNVAVDGARNAGIYIHQGTVGAIIRNSSITNAFSICVYLDAFSKHSTVTNNTFIDCGFRAPKFNVAETPGNAREGLAIDGSSDNIITNNTFKGNAAGGIFVYKNCSENNALGGMRTEPAANNIISKNTFSDMPVGVWVASRQSRNLSKWRCADTSPYPGEMGKIYFLDYAPGTKIVENTFSSMSEVGVRIEDDFTTVTNNRFIASTQDTEIGGAIRAKVLRRPIKGTIISDNKDG